MHNNRNLSAEVVCASTKGACTSNSQWRSVHCLQRCHLRASCDSLHACRRSLLAIGTGAHALCVWRGPSVAVGTCAVVAIGFYTHMLGWSFLACATSCMLLRWVCSVTGRAWAQTKGTDSVASVQGASVQAKGPPLVALAVLQLRDAFEARLALQHGKPELCSCHLSCPIHTHTHHLPANPSAPNPPADGPWAY